LFGFGWSQKQVLEIMEARYLAPDQQRADEIVHLRTAKKRTNLQTEPLLGPRFYTKPLI